MSKADGVSSSDDHAVHPATMFAFGIILVLALIEICGRQLRAPIPSLAGTTALAVIPVALVIGTSALGNPSALSGVTAHRDQI